MSKIAIMQPYFLPYIGYFQILNAVDEYVIYDDVQYIKGGWINRNNILIDGNPNMFTIALSEASPNKLINEINIKDDFVKFKKSLSMIYSKAPYRERVIELIEEICGYPNKNLADFNGNSIVKVAEYLKIKTKVIYSSSIKKDTNLNAQDKVLFICKQLSGDVYINAIGGVELYDRAEFAKQGVDLRFLKTTPMEYKQFKKTPVVNLSIIDVMMFNSPVEIKEMLNQYELI